MKLGHPIQSVPHAENWSFTLSCARTRTVREHGERWRMTEAAGATKRKRPDVSARRALQREREYTGVTCSLRLLCRSAEVYEGLQAVVCIADRRRTTSSTWILSDVSSAATNSRGMIKGTSWGALPINT